MSAAETMAAMAARRGMFADAERVLDETIAERDNLKQEAVLQRERISTLEAEVKVKDAEIARLTARLNEEQARVRMLQAFGTSIHTSLDDIAALIASAKAKANGQVQRLGVRAQDEETAQESADNKKLSELIDRLPPHNGQA